VKPVSPRNFGRFFFCVCPATVLMFILFCRNSSTVGTKSLIGTNRKFSRFESCIRQSYDWHQGLLHAFHSHGISKVHQLERIYYFYFRYKILICTVKLSKENDASLKMFSFFYRSVRKINEKMWTFCNEKPFCVVFCCCKIFKETLLMLRWNATIVHTICGDHAIVQIDITQHFLHVLNTLS